MGFSDPNNSEFLFMAQFVCTVVQLASCFWEIFANSNNFQNFSTILEFFEKRLTQSKVTNFEEKNYIVATRQLFSQLPFLQHSNF